RPTEAGLLRPPSGISGFIGWAFNMPLGSVRDFTGRTSPLGLEIQFDGWISESVSLGVSGEWAAYVEHRPRTTIDRGGGTLTATAYNYLQTTSLHFLLDAHFLRHAPVNPFVGLHAGMSWAAFDSAAADLELSDTQVSFNFGVETGARIPLGAGGPLALVNLRYALSPENNFMSVSNVQSVGWMLGLGF
ncbi:MAG TPA: hypothetical protein VG963_14900, partial [Polyangiaceae bacterium]|nr:hypothetical protein [Polyangiaceae bacterium]